MMADVVPYFLCFCYFIIFVQHGSSKEGRVLLVSICILSILDVISAGVELHYISRAIFVFFFQNASVEGLKGASEERRKEKKKGKEEREPGGRMIGEEIGFTTGTPIETKTKNTGR